MSKSSISLTKLHFFLATGFYSGYSPVAPGTIGSLIVLLILWFLPSLSLSFHIIGISLMFFIGIWTSSTVAQNTGKDPSIVNIDEMVGMWLPLSICPKSLVSYFFAFLLFRFFDIIKPFPIKKSEYLPDGWGIMMDDVLAGIYSMLIIGLFIILGFL